METKDPFVHSEGFTYNHKDVRSHTEVGKKLLLNWLKMAHDNLSVNWQNYRLCGHSFFPYHPLNKAKSKDNGKYKRVCLDTLDGTLKISHFIF